MSTSFVDTVASAETINLSTDIQGEVHGGPRPAIRNPARLGSENKANSNFEILPSAKLPAPGQYPPASRLSRMLPGLSGNCAGL
ncbi:hypothetical protein HPP92_015108 [Vanilla planifolia]|uniref:Uncharacterized protein n=1 Tax=Vanilla planifolia TaxID=51239 RepID=A0A835QLP2_VANPL|nr:hypothetical protein HPP92_015108 [Vanilla planifolia]